MKKLLCVLSGLTLALGMAGCAKNNQQNTAQSMPQDQSSYQSGYSGKLGQTKKNAMSAYCKKHPGSHKCCKKHAAKKAHAAASESTKNSTTGSTTTSTTSVKPDNSSNQSDY